MYDHTSVKERTAWTLLIEVKYNIMIYLGKIVKIYTS